MVWEAESICINSSAADTPASQTKFLPFSFCYHARHLHRLLHIRGQDRPVYFEKFVQLGPVKNLSGFGKRFHQFLSCHSIYAQKFNASHTGLHLLVDLNHQVLREIEKNVPETLDVHIIVDNYATHKHPRVKRWLVARQRFHVHFTPTPLHTLFGHCAPPPPSRSPTAPGVGRAQQIPSRLSKRAHHREALRAVGSGTAGAIGGRRSAHLACSRTATRGTRRVPGERRARNSFQIKANEWWTRGES